MVVALAVLIKTYTDWPLSSCRLVKQQDINISLELDDFKLAPHQNLNGTLQGLEGHLVQTNRAYAQRTDFSIFFSW